MMGLNKRFMLAKRTRANEHPVSVPCRGRCRACLRRLRVRGAGAQQRDLGACGRRRRVLRLRRAAADLVGGLRRAALRLRPPRLQAGGGQQPLQRRPPGRAVRALPVPRLLLRSRISLRRLLLPALRANPNPVHQILPDFQVAPRLAHCLLRHRKDTTVQADSSRAHNACGRTAIALSVSGCSSCSASSMS